MRKIDLNEIDSMQDIPLKPNEKPIIPSITPNYTVEKIHFLEQKHIFFKDCENYLDFYSQIDNFYNDEIKEFTNGDSHHISRYQVVKPLKFLFRCGVSEKKIKGDMKYFKYVNIDSLLKDKDFLCVFGEPDAQKTTMLLSLVISTLTDRIYKNIYYNCESQIYLDWDDIMDFNFWKNNESINDRYYDIIYIDDSFNRQIDNEYILDKFITLLRRAEKHGSKVIFTTNKTKNSFMACLKNLGNSLYSRYNESRFSFREQKPKNYRNKGE